MKLAIKTSVARFLRNVVDVLEAPDPVLERVSVYVMMRPDGVWSAMGHHDALSKRWSSDNSVGCFLLEELSGFSDQDEIQGYWLHADVPRPSRRPTVYLRCEYLSSGEEYWTELVSVLWSEGYDVQEDDLRRLGDLRVNAVVMWLKHRYLARVSGEELNVSPPAFMSSWGRIEPIPYFAEVSS